VLNDTYSCQEKCPLPPEWNNHAKCLNLLRGWKRRLHIAFVQQQAADESGVLCRKRSSAVRLRACLSLSLFAVVTNGRIDLC
jgi:hypothetical protein